MRETDFLEALICGFLIALTAALFVEYFGIADIGPQMLGVFMGGLLIIDLAILLLIGWPFRFSGVVAFFVITMIFGYAAYGPYNYLLQPYMSQMGSSLSDLPGMAEQQMHCMMLIFTNPMAYQSECVIPEQDKGVEEKPQDYGLEITNFEMLPEKNIYPGMPLMIRLTLENMGDYPAENVEIETTAGEYAKCDLSILKGLDPENGTKKLENPVIPETSYPYTVKGMIEDPWESCTYAKNKAIISGTITTTYSYDYRTESHLENIEIIKNIDETEPNFRVESAKEKAAPATILMYTFVPLIWEGAEGYRQAIIPVSLNNERKDGTVVFKGKYEYDWLTAIEREAKIWLSEWTPVGENTYEYCVNTINTSQELSRCEKEVEDKNITIKTENGSACLECGGVPVYKWHGKKTRTKSEYDKITIKPIGDAADYIILTCGDGETTGEGKIAGCTCSGGKECTIRYTGERSDLKIRPGKEELLYSGLTVKLKEENEKSFPKESTKISFALYAEATYTLELSEDKSLQIKNPHYEK